MPALPPFTEPQIAMLVDDVPTATGWVYEIKFAGYRTLADGVDVRCYFHNGLDRPLWQRASRHRRAENGWSAAGRLNGGDGR